MSVAIFKKQLRSCLCGVKVDKFINVQCSAACTFTFRAFDLLFINFYKNNIVNQWISPLNRRRQNLVVKQRNIKNIPEIDQMIIRSRPTFLLVMPCRSPFHRRRQQLPILHPGPQNLILCRPPLKSQHYYRFCPQVSSIRLFAKSPQPPPYTI